MESKINKIRSIAEGVLAILVALTGVAFIVGCAVLYFTGGDLPYSRERVGEFLLIYAAVPSALTVAFAIAVYIIGLISDKEDEKLPGMLTRDILASLSARLELSLCSAEGRDKILRERRHRRLGTLLTLGLSLVLCVVGLIYMTLIAHYAGGSDFSNLDVINVLAVVLPMAAVMLGGWAVLATLNDRSRERELAIIKGEAAADKSVLKKPEKKSAESSRAINYVRAAVLVASVVLVTVGIFNGGMSDVLGKAVKICTECIGLG